MFNVDGAVLAVRIPGRASPFGLISVFTRDEHDIPPNAGDFIRSIANILGGKLQSEASTRAQRRHIRFQSALAECAQALLVHSEQNPLEQAARALLSATDAESVFVERNVMHPELGLCSQIVAEADRPGTAASRLDSGYDYWDLTPWDRMPTSRDHLERGEPFFLVPSELTGVEFDLYAADPFSTKSELDIPIFVRGEWVGLIAFSESEVAREWEDQDLMLLKAAAQMVGAYWEAEVTNEELTRLIASKDQLIASVSHELRTPLTSVVGFAKLLEIEGSDLESGERAMVIRTIAEEGVDLANIIDDLLVAAKAESGTLEVVSVPIDLRAQAAQVVEACRPEDVQRIHISDEAIRGAEGDPARVRQVLRNLVSNAIRYGGHHIRVEFASDDDWSTVRVVDDGLGIPAEKRDRVFESYYRGEEDPGLAGSMGLGLSISRQLAERMGGNLSYEYLDDESVFELRLPRSIDPA
jgi:signal transduction histidine kinase